MAQPNASRMNGRVANQLENRLFHNVWNNTVINAHTVCVLLSWHEFRMVPRPLLSIVYIVLPTALDVIPDNERPKEPKVKLLVFDRNSSEDERLQIIRLAVDEAKLEHQRMTELKLLLRQLRGLVRGTGVQSVDDLVSACKGYNVESEELGRAAHRQRHAEIYKPPPGSSMPEGCQNQLEAANLSLLEHDDLMIGSMPLRLAFPNDANQYPSTDLLNEQQKNARVIKLVKHLSPKADELRLGAGVQRASPQEAYAILPDNPQLNNGYACAVLDGLDQLNYARYLVDTQGADSLPLDARVRSFDQLFVMVTQLVAKMPSAGDARA